MPTARGRDFRFARCWGAIPRRIGIAVQQYSSCGGVTSTAYRLFGKVSSFRSRAISKLVCPKTKLQSPSNRSLAPLNSGSFAPFRLKVVSDAARSRRDEIGLR